MSESKGTIFIMDDDLALQTVLEYALRAAGYDVVLAPEASQRLEKIDQSYYKF